MEGCGVERMIPYVTIISQFLTGKDEVGIVFFYISFIGAMTSISTAGMLLNDPT